jgi:hypothetical protein
MARHSAHRSALAAAQTSEDPLPLPMDDTQAAPAWPLGMVLAGFPVWWLVGLGDAVLFITTIIVTHQFVRRRRIPLVPRGFGVWLLFVAWMSVSVVGIDSFGRLVGFTYRALLYFAATAVFLYVYSNRPTFTLRKVASLLTGFWMVCVVGGYVGVLFPLLTWRTPLASVMPRGLLANELVQEMMVRRVTQFNPDAYFLLTPRPSAPFLYTNTWGAAYSVLTPIVIAHAVQHLAGSRRALLLAAVVASTIPAFLTLNRGMFIGLGVAGLYIGIRGVLAGNVRVIAGVFAVGIVAMIVLATVPVGERLDQRLESSASTENRAALYSETLTRTLESPVFGFGAPRPSNANLTSVGTQGHVWMVMFSHGIPATILFIVWLAVAWANTAHHRSGVGLAMNTAFVVIGIEIWYYGVVGMVLFVLMTAGAAAWRPPPAVRPATPLRAGRSEPAHP